MNFLALVGLNVYFFTILSQEGFELYHFNPSQPEQKWNKRETASLIGDFFGNSQESRFKRGQGYDNNIIPA